MSRILIHDPRHALEWGRTPLVPPGHDLIVCPHCEAVLNALADRRADLVVYVLSEFRDDLAALSLLRRMAPSLPIILLGERSDLETRRRAQEVRPTYFGVLPIDSSELQDAVRSALGPRTGARTA